MKLRSEASACRRCLCFSLPQACSEERTGTLRSLQANCPPRSSAIWGRLKCFRLQCVRVAVHRSALVFVFLLLTRYANAHPNVPRQGECTAYQRSSGVRVRISGVQLLVPVEARGPGLGSHGPRLFCLRVCGPR